MRFVGTSKDEFVAIELIILFDYKVFHHYGNLNQNEIYNSSIS